MDLLFDQLRSKVDLNWERLQLEFKSLDPKNSGFISKEDFQVNFLNFRTFYRLERMSGIVVPISIILVMIMTTIMIMIIITIMIMIIITISE